MTRTAALGWRPVLLAGIALLAACGTRLPDEAFVQAGQTPTGGGATGAGSGSVTSGGTATGGGGTTGSGATGTGTGSTGTGAPAAGSGTSTGGAGATDPGTGGGAAGPNQASDVGVTETTIRIGTIVAENGVLGDTFAPAATGLRAWVEHVNAQGGIGGRTVELFTCDDREDRARALECARSLVEQDQVFALISTNTRAMGGAAPYLFEQGIPVVGQPINNSFYRYPNFFPLYGSYYGPRDGSTVGAGGQLTFRSTAYRYFRDVLGVRTAAVFQYDVAESAQAGDFFRAALEAEGISTTTYTVSFAAPSFDAPVADMQRQGTQLIVDALDEGANRRLCDAMDRRSFTVLAKSSTVPLMGDSFPDNFGGGCRTVTYIPHNSLPYTDTSNPFVATFREGFAQYQRGRETHQWALEAWVMGQMLQDYLVAAGPAPTRQGFIDNLNAYNAASPAGVMTPDIQFTGDPGAARVEDCMYIIRWDDASGGWVDANGGLYCIPDAFQVSTAAAENGA